MCGEILLLMQPNDVRKSALGRSGTIKNRIWLCNYHISPSNLNMFNQPTIKFWVEPKAPPDEDGRYKGPRSCLVRLVVSGAAMLVVSSSCHRSCVVQQWSWKHKYKDVTVATLRMTS